jgi:glycosyltransferase involved in cell wall biosynthesis
MIGRVRVCVVDPVSYTLPYDSSLAKGLAERGHEVDLLAARFQYGSPPRPDGYRLREVFFTASERVLRFAPRSRVRLLVKGLEYGPNVRRLLRTIEEVDPDLVHVQWLGIPQLDRRWLARLVRRRAVVFTAHDVVPRRWERKLDLWRTIFATVDRVVVHGRGAVARLEELGVDPGRIARIPHPLFSAPPGATIEPPRGHTLLFFGLIRASKGVDLLLRALPVVAERVPGARLVVAGDPLEPIDPLVRLARELRVADRVEWRLRYIQADEIAPLMAEATAVVLPYRRIESSGVLATALGHGRPAVVTNVGSLGDTVREFDAGLVVPPEDAGALAEACSALLESKEMLARAVAGTDRARAALTWEEAARAHEELYGAVLSERS